MNMYKSLKPYNFYLMNCFLRINLKNAQIKKKNTKNQNLKTFKLIKS